MYKVTRIKERCAICKQYYTLTHCVTCNKAICPNCTEYSDNLNDTNPYCPTCVPQSPLDTRPIPKPTYTTRDMYPEEHILDLLHHYWYSRGLISDEQLFDYLSLLIKGQNPFKNGQLLTQLEAANQAKSPHYDIYNSPAMHVTNEQLRQSLLEHLQTAPRHAWTIFQKHQQLKKT